MSVLLFGLFIVLTSWTEEAGAAMVRSCFFGAGVAARGHLSAQLYVADDTNRCIFYMCAAGGQVMQCAPGSGLPLNYIISTDNPCTERVSNCRRGVTGIGTGGLTGTQKPWTMSPVGRGIATPTPTPGPVPMTTIPPRTTTAPTPQIIPTVQNTPACPPTRVADDMRAIVEVFRDSHILGARVEPNILNLRDCYSFCVRDETPCNGFDWNSVNLTCWIHGPSTACQPLFEERGTVHYRMMPCVSSPGMHVLEGVERPDAQTLNSCVSTCLALADCQAVDFDSRTNQCWHHLGDSVCRNDLLPKDSCTHVRLRNLCTDGQEEVDTAGGTDRGTGENSLLVPVTNIPVRPPVASRGPSPTVPTRTTRRVSQPIAPTPTPIQEGPTLSPDVAMAYGFVVREAGRYVPGGLPLGGFLTEEQCLVRCAEIPSCLAVDYNIRNGTCFTHNQNTSCNPLVLRSDFIHHRRVVCSSADDPFLAVFDGSHILNGLQLNGNFSNVDCQVRCLQEPECQGVDFNSADNSCWLHPAANECALPTPKPDCRHYRKRRC